MKVKNLFDSFNCAFQGIVYAVKTQRNMKIHFIAAAAVMTLTLFFNLSRLEIIILFIAISLVVIAEMINTAIETVVDLITDQYHVLAKIAKNVAAGAVLISAINSLIVFYLIFFNRLEPYTQNVFYRIKQSPVHITFIILFAVIFVTIAAKAYFGKGMPLKGGMPSGHAAVGFAIAAAITLVTQNMLISVLAVVMALLVCQSRIEGKIHTVFEVTVGALLGIMITIIFFQVFG